MRRVSPAAQYKAARGLLQAGFLTRLAVVGKLYRPSVGGAARIIGDHRHHPETVMRDGFHDLALRCTEAAAQTFMSPNC